MQFKTRLYICGTPNECRFYQRDFTQKLHPKTFTQVNNQITYQVLDIEYRAIFVTPAHGPVVVSGLRIDEFFVLGTAYDQPGISDFIEHVRMQMR